MKHFKLVFLSPILLILYACPMAPGSRIYKPVNIEQTYFAQSTRCFLPNDAKKLKNEIDRNKLLNWTGIINGVNIINDRDSLKFIIIVDHKYWDFIEDFSIQDEKIFLSEKGEGIFYFTKKYPLSYKPKLDSISNNYEINDFIICYGNLKNSFENIPELNAQFSRVISNKFYSTKIWRYDVKKDENGKTICKEKNSYEIENLEILKIPKAEQNK